MPENRYYTVTQEREVKVSAASPLDAAKLASAIFRDDKTAAEQMDGSQRSQIRDRDLNVREDY